MHLQSRRWVVAKMTNYSTVVAGSPVPVPMPGNGECLVRAQYFSVDPGQSFAFAGAPNNSTAQGFLIATVIASTGCPLADGTPARLHGDFAEYQVVSVGKLELVPTALRATNQWPLFLGPAGANGATALLGIDKVGLPKPGDLAYVSAAAGATGSMAVQILKMRGCTVIGSAGSDAEVRPRWVRLHNSASRRTSVGTARK